jgi:hypothetical protein
MAGEEDVLRYFRATSWNLPVTTEEYHEPLLRTTVHRPGLDMNISVIPDRLVAAQLRTAVVLVKLLEFLMSIIKSRHTIIL